MKTPYMNPYLAGFLLGMTLLATIVITGRGLGASGALKSAVVATVNTISPQHADESKFYAENLRSLQENPLKTWLVFEVLGVIIGGFLSGVVSDRLNFTTERGPRITNSMRLGFALIGGAVVRPRGSFCPGVPQRRWFERIGGCIYGWNHHHDGDLRYRICGCLFL